MKPIKIIHSTNQNHSFYSTNQNHPFYSTNQNYPTNHRASIPNILPTPPYPLSVDGDSSLLIAREVEDVDSTDLGIHVSRFEQLIEQLLG